MGRRILKLCKPEEGQAELYRNKSGEYAQRGFRTLGVAVQENGGKWQMLGLIPMCVSSSFWRWRR